MKNLKRYLRRFSALAAAATIAATFLSVPMHAVAAPADDIKKGVSASGGSGDVSRINDVVELAINIFSIVVGIAAVIMIIVAGLKYVTSSGDSTSINGAKNTILFAVIGLIVVALAQILVRFVLDEV